MCWTLQDIQEDGNRVKGHISTFEVARSQLKDAMRSRRFGLIRYVVSPEHKSQESEKMNQPMQSCGLNTLKCRKTWWIWCELALDSFGYIGFWFWNSPESIKKTLTMLVFQVTDLKPWKSWEWRWDHGPVRPCTKLHRSLRRKVPTMDGYERNDDHPKRVLYQSQNVLIHTAKKNLSPGNFALAFHFSKTPWKYHDFQWETCHQSFAAPHFWSSRGFYIPVITLQTLVTTREPPGLKMRLHYVRDYLSKVTVTVVVMQLRWDAPSRLCIMDGYLAAWRTQYSKWVASQFLSHDSDGPLQ